MNETPLPPHPLTFSILALADLQGRPLHLLPLICPRASASGGKLMTPVLSDSGSCHAAPVADGALSGIPLLLPSWLHPVTLWFLFQEACRCLLLFFLPHPSPGTHLEYHFFHAFSLWSSPFPAPSVSQGLSPLPEFPQCSELILDLLCLPLIWYLFPSSSLRADALTASLYLCLKNLAVYSQGNLV